MIGPEWAGFGLNAVLVVVAVVAMVVRQNAKAEEHAADIQAEKVARESLAEALRIEHDKTVADERAGWQAALAREREDRERGDSETRSMTEAAMKAASVMNEKLLAEINDEIRRCRHDLASLQTIALNVSSEVARADGRREAFEDLVKGLMRSKP